MSGKLGLGNLVTVDVGEATTSSEPMDTVKTLREADDDDDDVDDVGDK